jgi:hypothetical protein
MSELLHISISQPFRVLRLIAALEKNARAFGSFRTIHVNSLVVLFLYSDTTAALAEL